MTTLAGHCRRAVLSVCSLVAAFGALAAPSPEAAARERIRVERTAANAAFEAHERECRTRFVVTSCVEAARRDQRETLNRLQAEQALLDDAQHKERAAQRLRQIDENLRREQARPGQAVDIEPRNATHQASTPRVRVRPAKPESKRGPVHSAASAASAALPADRRSEEARKRDAFAASREAARTHRDAVEKRNAERAFKGKAAAPLPLPPGVPAPP